MGKLGGQLRKQQAMSLDEDSKSQALSISVSVCLLLRTTWGQFKKQTQIGIVAQGCNFRTQEAEVGES